MSEIYVGMGFMIGEDCKIEEVKRIGACFILGNRQGTWFSSIAVRYKLTCLCISTHRKEKMQGDYKDSIVSIIRSMY
jgi:hypothetical protein